MNSNQEAREVYPVKLFASRPPLAGAGDGAVKDFRAKPIPVALPVPASSPPAVEPDPKALSSATGSATPSQPGDSPSGSSPIKVLTNEEIARIFQSDGQADPASVVKEPPLIDPESRTTSGEPKLPVETTGRDESPAVETIPSSQDGVIPRTPL